MAPDAQPVLVRGRPRRVLDAVRDEVAGAIKGDGGIRMRYTTRAWTAQRLD